ncbi:hypothetical protein HOY80DRAFT_1033706 [Tuber brumale]|nr:hypothetical protein HOY80DRAFT_1033706 [Tuber brumale]
MAAGRQNEQATRSPGAHSEDYIRTGKLPPVNLMKRRQLNELVDGDSGRAGDVIFLGGCGEGVGGVVKASGWRDELEEGAKPGYTVGAKAGRLMEAVEHGLSAVNGWKESAKKEAPTQGVQMTKMVEGDLRGEHGEVSHVDQQMLRVFLADQPTRSRKNMTNLNTAA